jgi:hypothetical protein
LLAVLFVFNVYLFILYKLISRNIDLFVSSLLLWFRSHNLFLSIISTKSWVRGWFWFLRYLWFSYFHIWDWRSLRFWLIIAPRLVHIMMRW